VHKREAGENRVDAMSPGSSLPGHALVGRPVAAECVGHGLPANSLKLSGCVSHSPGSCYPGDETASPNLRQQILRDPEVILCGQAST
jgi:hypothetical protein